MTTLNNIYQQLWDQYRDPTQHEQVHSFSDKGNPHTYLDFYNTWFEPHRSHVSLLEIGIKTGGSLLLWSRYFHSYDLVGVDIASDWSAPRPFQSKLEHDPNIDLIWRHNSEHPLTLNRQFDFVIDDGSHDPRTQFRTWLAWHSHLRPGGVYFIEDIESQSAVQDLRRWIQSVVDGPVEFTHYRGRTEQRADDQILAIKLS